MKKSLFSIILLAITYQASAEPCMVIFEHGQLITLPAAVTQADQVKGMSGENHSTGLILAWKTAEPRAVWMKNTPTPLTAAFIGADGVIQSIQDMQPNSDTAHSSLHPTIAIIEMRTEKFKQFRLSPSNNASQPHRAASTRKTNSGMARTKITSYKAIQGHSTNITPVIQLSSCL
ncbi:DUF192 domain-containing protein [Citrobacter freundii]|uniref:DUF192 domain-containing protein n=2 Tax=Citrobacter TaxID=544 RepID=UPI000FD8FA74|nr:DUF192 domain-containing protein [Citrobacter freundii]RVR82899.1 DUF192 domain-containing protein [Citrobacter freundii]